MFAKIFRQMLIRPIKAEDNQAIAEIIRSVMTEYGAVGEGFSIMDPEVDQMSLNYVEPSSAYFVLEDELGCVVGGCGFGPLAGAETQVCELRKMYYLPKARGKGYGKRMLEQCLEEARKRGYTSMYLESIASMKEAANLYVKAGFTPIAGPVGNTGHNACNSFYIKVLTESHA